MTSRYDIYAVDPRSTAPQQLHAPHELHHTPHTVPEFECGGVTAVRRNSIPNRLLVTFQTHERTLITPHTPSFARHPTREHWLRTGDLDRWAVTLCPQDDVRWCFRSRDGTGILRAIV